MNLKSFILCSLAIAASLSANLQFEGAVFYRADDYNHDSFYLYPDEGITNLQNLSLGFFNSWNDEISSIAVWGDVIVYLFEHANYQGDYIVLTEHTPALGNWDDRISSIWVEWADPAYQWDSALQSWIYHDQNWIYHYDGLGWLYAGYYHSDSGSGWLWDAYWGWLYTDAYNYPWFSSNYGDLYFLPGSSRWWFYQNNWLLQ